MKRENTIYGQTDRMEVVILSYNLFSRLLDRSSWWLG